MTQIIFIILASLTFLLSSSAYAAPPKAGNMGSKSDASAKRLTGASDYIAVMGLNASVEHNFRVTGILSVDVGLQIPDKSQRERINAIRPRLRSGLRETVAGYAYSAYIPGTVPDIKLLRFRIQKSVDRILGSGVASVTLSSVIIHPK